MACELMHAELLDNLKDVELLGEFFASIFVQEVLSAALGAAAATALLVAAHQAP